MSAGQRTIEHQAGFTRQAAILRRNLQEWDGMLRNPRGEDWPTMLGRLNAAYNQTANLDKSVDDVLEHFVYVPKKSTANPQDIPFFLSTRLESIDTEIAEAGNATKDFKGDPILQLAKYEAEAAQIAAEYEANMIRF